jgi:hypothetical protein
MTTIATVFYNLVNSGFDIPEQQELLKEKRDELEFAKAKADQDAQVETTSHFNKDYYVFKARAIAQAKINKLPNLFPATRSRGSLQQSEREAAVQRVADAMSSPSNAATEEKQRSNSPNNRQAEDEIMAMRKLEEANILAEEVMHAETLYYGSLEVLEAAGIRKRQAISELVTLKSDIERLIVQGAILTSFQQASVALASKVASVLSRANHQFSNIKSSLKDGARWTVGSRTIVRDDPLSHGDLSGTLFLLNKNYKRATVITMLTDILASQSLSFSAAESDTNPMRGFEKSRNMRAQAQSAGWFPKMTEDLYFSICHIAALDLKSSIRNKLLTDVLQHVRITTEHAELTGTDSRDIRLWEFISDWYNTYQAVTSPTPKRTKESIDHERAAAAASSESAVTPKLFLPGAPYTTEIPKSKGITVTFNLASGKEITVPYVAVKDKAAVCNNCYGTGGTPCSKRCFCNQCAKCALYGHIHKQCQQKK